MGASYLSVVSSAELCHVCGPVCQSECATPPRCGVERLTRRRIGIKQTPTTAACPRRARELSGAAAAAPVRLDTTRGQSPWAWSRSKSNRVRPPHVTLTVTSPANRCLSLMTATSRPMIHAHTSGNSRIIDLGTVEFESFYVGDKEPPSMKGRDVLLDKFRERGIQDLHARARTTPQAHLRGTR
jgi:hypothetical protein